MRPTPPRTPTAPPLRPVPPAWSAAVGAALGACYLALAPAVTGNKDSAEITLALAFNGVPHPTGYPLFTLLGHAFVVALHGLGASWGYTANAWSAVGGGVAMALYHALAARCVPPRRAVGRMGRFGLALVPALVFGLSPFWLLDVTVAEVYSWHLAWVCATCLVALHLVRSLGVRSRDGAGAGWNAPRPEIAAAVWGLVCGLGLAHHRTAVLFIVPLSLTVLVALARARLLRARLVVVVFAGLLVPLTSYAFVAYRASHPAAFQWPSLQPTVQSVLAHVVGGEYRDLLGRFSPSDYQRVLLGTFVYPILFPALAGLAWGAFRARDAIERLALGGLLAAVLVQTLYAFSYGVSDPSSYFHPNVAVALLTIPLLGAGLLRRTRVAAIGSVLAAAGLVMLAALGLRFGVLARQDLTAIERNVRTLWRSIPAGEGIVLWRDDMAPTLRGYQLLEGERRDLYVQDPNQLTWPGPRQAFAARFGFDPFSGSAPITAADLALLPETMSGRTPLPVYVFDPWRGGVQPIQKRPARADSLADRRR